MQLRMGREDPRQEDREERWMEGAEGILTLHKYIPDTEPARWKKPGSPGSRKSLITNRKPPSQPWTIYPDLYVREIYLVRDTIILAFSIVAKSLFYPILASTTFLPAPSYFYALLGSISSGWAASDMLPPRSITSVSPPSLTAVCITSPSDQFSTKACL